MPPDRAPFRAARLSILKVAIRTAGRASGRAGDLGVRLKARAGRIACSLLAALAVIAAGAYGLRTTLPQRNSAHPGNPGTPSRIDARQQEGECGGGKAGPSGRVTAAELPWAAAEPERLQRLRERYGVRCLVAAFRTTLPDPILEELHNIRTAARLLAGTVLEPGAVFSQNATLGPYSRARGYREGPSYVGDQIVPSVGGGVCKIASTLYNAVVMANLQVVERHSHSMLVPYVPPGQDATVSRALDFRFRNNTPAPVVLWAETAGRTLFIAIYGDYTPPRVEWHHEVLAREATPVVRRPNRQLRPGQERVVIAGAEGITVRTWLTIHHPDRVERRDLGIDRYRPMPRVVEFGPR